MRNLSWWKKAFAVLLHCAATAIAAQAQTFTTIVNFDGTNGGAPYYGALVQGRDGHLYGTTKGGGSDNQGTVFRVSPAGKVTSLYSFCAQTNCIDGSQPYAGLVLGVDGNFYGTTALGGVSCSLSSSLCGTVFRLTLSGTLTTLYSFCAQVGCPDGNLPESSLVQATDGNLYGVTYAGGNCENTGCGTIFRITPQGFLTTMRSFNFDDGEGPVGALIQANDKSLYGTTSACLFYDCFGTVYKMTLSGALTTLYSFGSEGEPYGALVQTPDGLFYGTTVDCAIFDITSAGAFTYLDCIFGNEGYQPYAGLALGSDGNLYGTAVYGGTSANCPSGCGTVFQVTPSGSLTSLHSFQLSDGAYPYSALYQATDGKFYGTTSGGGAVGVGTIFSLDMGLAPFVTFVRAAGKVGQTGGILGQGFTGTTNVSLNGIPASFTVVSDTFIKATVPAGAATGYVTVITPSGTLTSNVPFHVIK
jgi:uncharacterized repeat protein (TIGR03803 family)